MFVGSSPSTTCVDVDANWYSGELKLRDCGFESACVTVDNLGDWTWESKLSVKQSLSMSNGGSIPSRPTEVDLARCDVGICSKPLKLALAGSIPVESLRNHDVVELVDTRCSNVVP